LNVLIVEDEAPAARRLRRLVAKELAIEPDSIVIIDNLDSACEYLAETSVELLLLDLDLSGCDGFKALRVVQTNRPATVIVSANLDRAIEAFDHDVVDFVAKKTKGEGDMASREIRSNTMRLIIRSLGRVEIVPINLVVRLAGADDYVQVVTTDDRMLLHYDRLDKLERQLPSGFIRTHRSHIINSEYLIKVLVVSRGQHVALTSDGEQVPISRRRVKAIKKSLYL